jgi:hypothetical protein
MGGKAKLAGMTSGIRSGGSVMSCSASIAHPEGNFSGAAIIFLAFDKHISLRLT